ncbi:MAG: sterol desaturase family protein [Microthrixaceae bacterium]
MELSYLVLFMVGLSLVGVELAIRSWRKLPVDRHETAVSAAVGVAWFAMKGVAGYAGVIASYGWIARWVPWQLDVGNPLTWLSYLLVGDFAYYWVHRAEHRVGVLWAAHVVHHSAEDFGFTTAVRMPPTEILYKPLTGLWAPLLGFPPAMYAPMAAWGLIFGQLQHTQLVGRIPHLDRWVATPSNHRVHHGSNPLYIDRNFGGQTMIWDRLFGTYEPESEPVRFGATESLVSRGVVGTAAGGYPRLAGRIADAVGWRSKVAVALGAPGSSTGCDRSARPGCTPGATTR